MFTAPFVTAKKKRMNSTHGEQMLPRIFCFQVGFCVPVCCGFPSTTTTIVAQAFDRHFVTSCKLSDHGRPRRKAFKASR